MLETLDDAVFAGLEDAYGPAVDVPGRLRDLMTADREGATDLIGDLGAGIYHQGSYFDSTAPTIPFLIELAQADIPARAEVLHFLTAMSGGASDPELAFQPFMFRSTPGLPEYPEAIATIEAIKLGMAVYVDALGASDPHARASAAHLLASLVWVDAGPAIERALSTETDSTTRIAFHMALVRLERRVETEETGIVADVIQILRTEAKPDEATLDAIGRLLLIEKKFHYLAMPFYEGDLVSFASLTLSQLDDARAFEVAAAALAQRFARGERINALPMPQTARVGDQDDADGEAKTTTTQASFRAYFSDVPLRSIASAMVKLAFGERANAPGLLCRSDLDERMTRVLQLTIDHGVPLPIRGAPWFEPKAMRRFLTGGGPLDTEITWEGRHVPLFIPLKGMVQSDNVESKDDARLDALFEAFTRTATDEALVDLAIDILGNGYGLAEYGAPKPEVARAIEKHLEPAAKRLPDRRANYADSLIGVDYVTRWQARLALAPAIEARTVVEARLDPLVRMAITDVSDESRAWLAEFPEPRRSRLVAGFGNSYLLEKLESVCDPKQLEREILTAFLARDCGWYEHEADRLIARLPDTEALQALAATATGRRGAILRRVISARTRTGIFRLSLVNDGEVVRATLYDGFDRTMTTGTLSSVPRLEELVPIVSLLSDSADLRLLLEGDLDSTLEYRVMRLIPEAGFRGTVQSQGGSTMSSS